MLIAPYMHSGITLNKSDDSEISPILLLYMLPDIKGLVTNENLPQNKVAVSSWQVNKPLSMRKHRLLVAGCLRNSEMETANSSLKIQPQAPLIVSSIKKQSLINKYW